MNRSPSRYRRGRANTWWLRPRRFGTIATVLGARRGDAQTAAKLDEELQKIQSRWDPMARHLNEPVTRRLQAARALARKAG